MQQKYINVIILDFVADLPSRDLQQHRRSPQVQACRRAYHYNLATVHRKLQRTQLQDPLKQGGLRRSIWGWGGAGGFVTFS